MFHFQELKANIKSFYIKWQQSVDDFNNKEYEKRLEFARLDKIKKFIQEYPQYEGLEDQLKLNFFLDDIKRKDLSEKESRKIVWNYMWSNTADDYSQLSDLYEDISPSMFDLYTLQQEKKELERVTPKVVRTRPMVRRLKEIESDQDLILQLGFRTFEELVKELFIQKGYEVELTPITHDRGHDLVATKQIDELPYKVVIECKRYASHRAVGVGKVRAFCDVIEREKANKGIMITTSYYSREAKKRKEEKGNLIELLDGKDLKKWIAEYVLNRTIEKL